MSGSFLADVSFLLSASRRIIPFVTLAGTKNLRPSKRGKRPVCGKKHKKRVAQGRILGGNSALPGTHPWMVAIYIGQSDFCAGTLISSCWVLSAAHCFFRKYVMGASRETLLVLKTLIGLILMYRVSKHLKFRLISGLFLTVVCCTRLQNITWFEASHLPEHRSFMNRLCLETQFQFEENLKTSHANRWGLGFPLMSTKRHLSSLSKFRYL